MAEEAGRDDAPRWRCGERGCPKRRRQPVETPGDPLTAALTELAEHYRVAHPEQQADEKEVVDGGHALAA